MDGRHPPLPPKPPDPDMSVVKGGASSCLVELVPSKQQPESPARTKPPNVSSLACGMGDFHAKNRNFQPFNMIWRKITEPYMLETLGLTQAILLPYYVFGSNKPPKPECMIQACVLIFHTLLCHSPSKLWDSGGYIFLYSISFTLRTM